MKTRNVEGWAAVLRERAPALAAVKAGKRSSAGRGGKRDSTTVRVRFSEAMTDDADLVNPAFYTFTGGGRTLTALSVERMTARNVDITPQEMTDGATYTVTVATASPTDLMGLHMDPAHNSDAFRGLGDPPNAPVITTNGGDNLQTNDPAPTIEGTCAPDTAEIHVNGAVDGVSYTAGATTWSYAATLSEGANDLSVTAVDEAANESAADTIRVTLDTRRPRVLDALGLDNDTVRVRFDEDMANNADLVDPAFYTITGGGVAVSVASVTRKNDFRVDLEVTKMTTDAPYTVTVSTASPTDVVGNRVDPAANKATFLGLSDDPPAHPCDVNFDGFVNAVDVQLVINAVLGGASEWNCDVNVDGFTNAVDVQLVINAALGVA